MKKILVAVLGLVVVLGIFAVVYRGDRVGFDKEHGKPVVKIGAILPLTGNLAYVGNFVKGAMEIAVYDANMRPNNKYHYEMVFEDNAFSAVKTIPVLNKLIFIDKVDALTTVGNSIGEIVGPIVEKNKVPHIGLTGDRNLLNKKYNFIHWMMPEVHAKKITETIKEKQYKRVQIVSAVSQMEIILTDVMTDNFKKAA